MVNNGHKRKHASKFQAINKLNDLIQHVAGQIGGRRHDWKLFVRSVLEEKENLPVVLVVDSE